jgi:hypothetical protein
VAAAFRRELSAQRVNRFLHVHLALAATAGLLPLFTPGDTGTAAPVWALQAVLYCLSLSSVVLGLSSAHGEIDEFELLFAQPVSRRAYLAGKIAALGALLLPSALLLVVPAGLTGGLSAPLAALGAAAGGVSLALAVCGLALGFWIRDRVRGLLAALGLYFVLLFGTDLLLLAVAGAPWMQKLPGLWVGFLMGNPLDSFRIAVLFAIDRVAFAGVDPGRLATWWLAHSGLWLALLLTAWTAGAFAAALAGAGRQVDA